MTGAVALIVYTGVTFLITPYVLGRIGTTQYGLFILVSSLFTYGGLLDLGIGGALVKLVAEYRARNDQASAAEVIATAVRLYTILALAGVALTLLAVAVVPALFNVPFADLDAARLVTLLIGLNLAVVLFATPATSVMNALQRYDIQNVLGMAGMITNAVGTVVVLSLGWGIVGMVALTIPITIGMRSGSAWYIRTHSPELALRWRGASWAVVRRLAPLSAAVFGAQVSGPLTKKTDEIVIGAFQVLSSITPYALAGKLSEVPFQLTNQFVKVLLPIASGLDAAGRNDRLRELYLVATRATLAIFVPMALVLAIYADLILAAWVGDAYASAAPILIVLVVANLALVTVYSAGPVLQGIGRFGIVARSSLLLSLLNLLLSIVLVQPLGTIGVAFGTLIPNVIGALLIIIPYTMKVLDVSIRSMLTDVALPVILPAVVTAGVLIVARAVFDMSTLGALLAAAVVASSVYFATYFAFRTTLPERMIVADALQRTIRIVRRLVPDHIGAR